MTKDSDLGAIIIDSPDGRLQARFLRRDDRYVHELTIGRDIGALSVDGQPEEAWPASPPIQQISLESIDGRKAVLGVGAAGTAHWSISADTSPERPDAIRFQLACKCGSRVGFLGSTYRDVSNIRIEPILGDARTEDETTVIIGEPSETGTHQWSYWVSLAAERSAESSDT